MNKKQRARLKLIGILSAFAGPLLIASVLYFGQQWFQFDTTSRGYLLAAGQTLSGDFRLIQTSQISSKEPVPLLDGRWLLLFHGTASCDLYCQANLFKMRQARLVLGRDAARVRTVYLLPEPRPTAELKTLLAQYPVLSVYQIGDPSQLAADAPALGQNQIFIVDPKGNLVMRYAQDAYSRDIIKDFKRLLKVSKIG